MSINVTPFLCAADVEAALVQCGLKIRTSMPAKSSVTLIHLEIVFLLTALYMVAAVISDAMGAVVEWVRALDWRPGGPGLRQLRFGTLAIPFTPLCQCLSKETLKAVGPFYLVSITLS